jgi:S-adenosylmethionine synthetase
MESVDEKRLRLLIKKLNPVTKITLNDMKRYPEAEIVIRTAKKSLDHILRYFDKENSIEINDYRVKEGYIERS